MHFLRFVDIHTPPHCSICLRSVNKMGHAMFHFAKEAAKSTLKIATNLKIYLIFAVNCWQIVNTHGTHLLILVRYDTKQA